MMILLLIYLLILIILTKSNEIYLWFIFHYRKVRDNRIVVEPSGVQALKNPNPLKDVEASVVLDVAVLV